MISVNTGRVHADTINKEQERVRVVAPLAAALLRVLRLTLGFIRSQVQNVQRPSLGAEWAWVLGRIGVVAVCFPSAYVFMRGTGADLFVYGGATFALAYSIPLIVLLRRGQVARVFFAGFILDNLTLLAGWWGVTAMLSGSLQTNDLYLVIFPILLIGVVRLGWFLGALYTTVWITWISWANISYYGPGSYDVEQLPIRIPMIAVTSVLALNLVAKLNSERKRAQDLQLETAELSELGRVAGSSLNLADVYGALSERAARLIPFDRLAVATVDGPDESVTLEYVSGEPIDDYGPGTVHPLAIPALRRAIGEHRPSIASAEECEVIDASLTAGGRAAVGAIRSMLVVPVLAGERVAALLILTSANEGAFSDHHLRLAGGIALYIADALANARSHHQALQLAEERELRSKLDAWNSELQRVSEAKTGFLSTLSHELRTPLTSIMAFNEIVMRSSNLSPRDQQHLAVLRRNAERLNTLIEDLLDVTRVELGKLKLDLAPLDTAELLNEVAVSFEPILARKRQRLKLSLPEARSVINADRVRVAQVVSNLLSNASKYSPAGSEIVLYALNDSERVHITVRDQGMGIAQPDVDRLFTAFFRAANEETRAQPGTGLGAPDLEGYRRGARRHDRPGQ